MSDGYDPYNQEINDDNSNDLSSQMAQGGDEAQQVSQQIASYGPQPTPQMSYAPGQQPVGLIDRPLMSVAPDQSQQQSQDQGQGDLSSDSQDIQQGAGSKESDAFETIKTYSGMMNNMLGLSTIPLTGGAPAPTGGDKTGGESAFFSKLMDGILNPKNANLTNLGANFIAGMFNYKSKTKMADAQISHMKASSDAALMNAQTAASAENLRQAGSRAMGLIDMPKQAPIQYKNLLAERRARSGAK